MELTTTEKIAMENIFHREQLAVERAIAPTNEARKAVVAEVEKRLGLKAGAIGTTHDVHPVTGVITGPPDVQPVQPE